MRVNKELASKRLQSRAWIADYVSGWLDEGGDEVLLKSEQEDLSSEKNNEVATVSQRLFLTRLLDVENDHELLSVMRKEHDNPRAEHLAWRVWYLKNHKRIPKEALSLGVEKKSNLRIQAQHDDTSSPKRFLNDCIRWNAEIKNHELKAEIDEEEISLAKDQGFSLNSALPVAVKTDEGGGKLNDDVSSICFKNDPNAAIEPELQIKPSSTLYIVLCSLHGLVRGQELELGRDSDTGGQVKYAIEHAKALAKQPNIARVDLLTRMVCAPDIDADYGVEEESLSSNAFIVRLPCGDKTKYIAKESLWPHVREFADRGIEYVRKRSKELRLDIQRSQLDIPECEAEDNISTFRDYTSPGVQVILHAHYADAMDALGMMAKSLDYPLVVTGHSLGRNKKSLLLRAETYTIAEIESKYKISRRIEAEERGLDVAEVLITSTRQEVEEQWELYDGFNDKLQEVFQRRRRQMGLHRFIPAPIVIPPGIEFPELGPEGEESEKGVLESSDWTEPPIWNEIKQFLTLPVKPAILMLCRPDEKKNIIRVIDAYGNSQALRDVANLVLILGNRDDIQKCASGPREILSQVLFAIDKYDLYGKVAYPKHHKQQDISDIYGYSAQTGGVFINSALQEPFGLTLIEAAGYGVPVVATKNGGPVDIIKTLDNGILVDPLNEQEIEAALLKIVIDRTLWDKFSTNGLKNIHNFSWNAHCVRYLESLKSHIPALYGRSSFTQEPPAILSAQHSLDKERTELKQAILELPRTITDHQNLPKATIQSMLKKPAPQKQCEKLIVAALPPNLENFDSYFKKLSAALSKFRIDNIVPAIFTFASTAPFFAVEEFIKRHKDLVGCDFSVILSSYGSDLRAVEGGDESLKGLCQSYEFQTGWRWAPMAVIKAVVEADLSRRISGFLENWEVSYTNTCIVASLKDQNKVSKVKNFKLAPLLHRALREKGLRANVFSVDNKVEVAVTPVRASLGLGVRHVANFMNINLSENVHVFAPESLLPAQDQIDSPYQELLTGSIQVHYV